MSEEHHPTYSPQEVTSYSDKLESLHGRIRDTELTRDLEVAEKLRVYMLPGRLLSLASAIHLDNVYTSVSDWLEGVLLQIPDDMSEPMKEFISNERAVAAFKESIKGAQYFAKIMGLASSEGKDLDELASGSDFEKLASITGRNIELTDQVEIFMVIKDYSRVLKIRFEVDESGGPLIQTLHYLLDDPRGFLPFEATPFVKVGFKQGALTYMAIYSMGKYHGLPGPNPPWKKT